MARRGGGCSMKGKLFSGAFGLRLISVIAFFVIWGVGSLALGPRLCPDPLTVIAFAWRETASGELPYHLAITLARVAAAFLIAMSIGLATGLVMGRSPFANALGEPWMILLLNAPALIIIV